jgi:PIN domain nuclease of toxin-antitoxin system
VKVLLDTHILLWYLLDDARLSLAAKHVIDHLENQVFVSPASYWEVAIKVSLGKYQLSESLDTFFSRELAVNQFTILPITIAHTAKLVDMPFHHRDPFDRLIIAQTLVEKMPIISADGFFDAYQIRRIW